MSKVKITQQGIKKTLNRIGVEEAVAEYVWNGFDARATVVRLMYKLEKDAFGFDRLAELMVADNGMGIPAELLENKFSPFLESEKSLKLKEENVGLEGKNGYGRLTFFKFARMATWHTCYQKGELSYKYDISISAQSLDDYNSSQEVVDYNGPAGTVVQFTGFPAEFHLEYLNKKLRPFIVNEFAWYLEVNRQRGLRILFQDEEISYESLIAEKEKFSIPLYKDSSRKETLTFDCIFVRWKSKLNDEFSRYYFLNEDGKLKYKTTTRFNKKGDYFYHSIIVSGVFFDNFAFYEDDEEEDSDRRVNLFSEFGDYQIFRALKAELNSYLRKKRKPFLHESAETLVNSYEKEGVMPTFGKNSWDKIRKSEFETLIKGLYEVEPALFVKLNVEQKKTFLHLMNLLLDSDERDKLFDILQNVVELDADDRARLSDLLKTTKLTNIIRTLKLVEDRLIALHQIKQAVFDHDLKVNERDHLQKIMEDHYWILGEQYSLVCAAEDKFETALRNYLHLLREEDQKVSVDHPDNLKEMDVFLVRQLYSTSAINHVVVELKNPTSVRRLGMKELNQVKTYMRVILSIDQFNAQSNSTWDFYLIGQDYDDAIDSELKNAQQHGEKDLAFKVANYKIFVKKWSEVFIDAELRLNWLNEKLKIERNKLSYSAEDANEIVAALHESTAAQSLEGKVEAVHEKKDGHK